MAIVTIQHRRGEYADYDPSKVLPGELVVTQTGDPNTTDGEAAYIATRAGSVKRIPFASEVEDLKTEMDDVVEDAREAIESAIDPTLTQSGKAADAKKTGDEIADLKSDLNELAEEVDSFSGLNDAVKTALLNCFQNVAWTDGNGQTYYNALETALRENEYPKIKAVFNSGTNVIYADVELDSLKQYLTVTFYEDTQSTGEVIPSSDYTISGILTDGENNIRVSYSDYSTLVKVNVVDFYNLTTFSTENLLVTNNQLAGNYNSTMGFNAPNNTRRGFFARHGHKGILEYQTLEPTNYYPIPVPKSATKCTVTVNEANMYFAVKKWHYNPDTNMYSTSYFDSGWQTSPYVVDLTPAENEFLTINIKNGSAGTASFTAEPTGSFVFE